jgi:hypothetical protein
MQSPGCDAVRTVNVTRSRIWVTIYDLGQLRHLDYGWVDACTYRDWRSGGYACGSFYHVRAEVKNADLSGNTYDTRVQINPQLGNPSSNTVILHRGTGNYYWEHSGGLWDPTTGQPALCDGVAPVGAPANDVGIANATKAPMYVDISGGGKPLILECLAAGETRRWRLMPFNLYGLSVDAYSDAACKNKTGGNASMNVFPSPTGVTLQYNGKTVVRTK